MLWPFVAIVAWLIFVMIKREWLKKEFDKTFKGAIFSGCFLSGVLSLAFPMVLDSLFPLPKVWEEGQTVQLVNVKRGGDKDIFLLTKKANEGLSYIYYVDDEIWPQRNSFSEQPGTSVNVSEEIRSGGELKHYQKVFASGWYWLIAFNRGGSKYEFHVPEGSVKKLQ